MSGGWEPPDTGASPGLPPPTQTPDRRQSRPTIDGAIGAGSGALLAAGVVIGVNDGWNRPATAISGALLLAAGFAASLLLDGSWRALRCAGVATGAVGIAALAVAIPSPDSGSFARAVLLLATIGYGVVWLAPGFRRHPVMLTIGLLTAAGLLTDLAGGIGLAGDLALRDEPSFSSEGEAQPEVLLLCGLAYVLVMRALDRRGDDRTATSFAVAGLVAVATAAASFVFLVGAFAAEGSLLLAAVVGVVVCIVGAASGRRATTWWGAALSVAGAGSFTVNVADLSSQRTEGAALVLAGAVVLAAAALVGRRRRVSDGSGARP